MNKKYTLDTLDEVIPDIQKPCLVFLYGDLWAWKTTLSERIIQQLHKEEVSVTSPTYVYYNKYEDIYHFDLYRLSHYDEFISIGGEEILDNNMGVILVEYIECEYKKI